MKLRSLRPRAEGVGSRVREAESVLVEQYGDLVRLAHLVLPASLGRHRQALLACRFGQHVGAASGRRSPNGHWYAPAAGSRAVISLSVSGDVKAMKQSRTLAVPAPGNPRITVRARLATGEALDAVGTPGT